MTETPGGGRRGFVQWWHTTPLYLRIIGALLLGVALGVVLGKSAEGLATPSKLILRILSTLAPPLILIAVIQALMKAEIKGKQAGRLAFLLVLNTVVAIIIGLVVANAMKPGAHAKLTPPKSAPIVAKGADPMSQRVVDIMAENGVKPPDPKAKDPIAQFLNNVPSALLEPLAMDGKVLGVILIAVAFGIALRKEKDTELRTVSDFVDVAMRTMLVILHWVIDIIPIAVFGIVASIIGTKGFSDFKALGMFVLTVLVALLLQAAYYLTRVGLGTWVRPLSLLKGGRDALVMAFSTASSTATMPVTYECLRKNVKLREESASMGSLVGSNFNNDGTALYEAMSALFISQMLGMDLNLQQQLLVVVTSIIASVGAAGIPEAGLVTMTLVFNAVNLPTSYIAMLLTVDWFLDRSRTAINVMGDMNVSCMLDGKTPEEPSASA